MIPDNTKRLRISGCPIASGEAADEAEKPLLPLTDFLQLGGQAEEFNHRRSR
jgi:hypothetical protein